MKHIILFALLIQFSGASTLTLKKVLASANNNNALSKAIDQEASSLRSKKPGRYIFRSYGTLWNRYKG